MVSGSAELSIGGESHGIVGARNSPFAGKPWSAYIPPKIEWQARASTLCEIAVCTGPAKGLLPSRLIAPESLGQETRGKGTNVRYVTNILPETEPAESLLVVEVITPGGHTSSYPPHKHDEDDFPRETQLEETYYHRLDPRQGFAFQRVYTDDRTIDEAIVVEDGDVTLVPRGYHPCAAVHGYSLYYLNVMAGPRRAWRFFNAREHEWILTA
jgi:5-deoxy-glucuronate isomerase